MVKNYRIPDWTFSLHWETDKRNDDQVESNEKFAVEFKTGAEYLQWLELQLPYVEVSNVFVSSQKYYPFCMFSYFVRRWYHQFIFLHFLLFKPFLPKDDTHYYFFRKWRKDDLKYYSEMEYLNVSKQPMSRVNHFQNMYTSISCLKMRVYLKIIKTPLWRQEKEDLS